VTTKFKNVATHKGATDMTNLIEEWKREEKAPFDGWDFSYLKGRMKEENLPWDYIAMAKRLVAKSDSVLDMGTGGGEIFSSFAPFPKKAVATEGYMPNYRLAKKRLGSLDVRIVKFSNSLTRKMPFKDDEFQLVLNRQDAFNAQEVFRILKGKGTFLTQQVGSGNLADLAKAFGATQKYKGWTLAFIRRNMKEAGFDIKEARECRYKTEFKDVGAIAYFLRAITWIVPNFSVDRDSEYLTKLQKRLESGKKLMFTQVRFLIKAEKP